MKVRRYEGSCTIELGILEQQVLKSTLDHMLMTPSGKELEPDEKEIIKNIVEELGR